MQNSFKNSKASETGLAEFRNRRIKYAVSSSVISKIFNIGVQLLAIPVAIKALGVEKYGVFVMLTAALSWVGMARVGIGPVLTKGTAESAAKGSQIDEARYFSTAFYFISLIGLIILVIILALCFIIPVENIFGFKYKKFTGEIQSGAILLGIILSLQIILSVVEAAQMGYQEQHINNLWGACGHILSLILLFVVSFWWPSIAGMIVAVYGGIVIARLLNGMQLIMFNHPHIFPRFQYFDKRLLKILVGTGLAFFLVQISGLINQQASLFLLGRELGPEKVVPFAVLLRLIFLALGVALMFTQPLWPAYMDAVSRRQGNWVRKTFKKILLILMGYAVIGGLTISIFGQEIIRLWVGKTIVPTIILQQLMGFYFVMHIWSHVHYMTLIGIGPIREPAIVLLAESFLMLVIALWLVEPLGDVGVAAALCISSVTVSAWLLPVMTKRRMNRICAAG